MKEIGCPKCGARCKVIADSSLHFYQRRAVLKHLKPFPQPDLTKLRKFHDLIVNDDIDVAIMDFSGSEKIQELWHAIKEVLDEVEGI